MSQEVVVTQEDINNIGKKLDEFAAVLTEHERMVLLGMLSLAGKAIHAAAASTPKPAEPAPPPLPPLSEGFRGAFVPGGAAKFTFDKDESEKVSWTTTTGTTWER